MAVDWDKTTEEVLQQQRQLNDLHEEMVANGHRKESVRNYSTALRTSRERFDFINHEEPADEQETQRR